MTARKRSSAALLAVVVLLAFATRAPAVTLTVNGDTPSMRYQRVADELGARLPLPSGTVTLFLRGCPDGPPACVRWSNDPFHAVMYLDPGELGEPENLRQMEAHELGHLFVEQTFTAADRFRFATVIWRRPAISWGKPLATCPDGLSIAYRNGAYCGPHSAASEWAADAYRLCATGRWRRWDVRAWLGLLPDQANDSGPLGGSLSATRAPIIASCGLFRDTARRPEAK